MFSTTLTVVDGFPRALGALFGKRVVYWISMAGLAVEQALEALHASLVVLRLDLDRVDDLLPGRRPAVALQSLDALEDRCDLARLETREPQAAQLAVFLLDGGHVGQVIPVGRPRHRRHPASVALQRVQHLPSLH